MESKVKKRENDLTLNNERLVYYLRRKFENHPLYDEDDFASIGMIGLIKAARSFDDSKNIRFATYASRCINNEILQYIRKNKAHAEVTSLEDILAIDAEGKNLTLEDLVASEDSDFSNEMPEREMLENLLTIVLNYFSGRNRLLWLYTIAGIKQRELSDILGISQSYISRLENKIKKKLRLLLSSKLNFKEVFSMSITQNSFFIHFSAKDVENFNTVFADFLQKRILNRELLEFKVKRVQDTVTIQLPCDTDSFAFIADIIKELDSDYTLLCAQKQSKITEPTTADTNVINKEKTPITNIPVSHELPEEIGDDLPFSEEVVDAPLVSKELSDETNDMSFSEDSSEEMDALSEVKNSTKRHSGLSGEIKNYILSLQTSEQFSNQQILSKFPTCSGNLLSQITLNFKKKGIISSVSRGCYQKN